jgi:2-oxoglutarate ferredoxin oxidoreductase subunit gamma
MMKQNILISGTGGQGIVAAGAFLGQALFAQDLEVMFSRSYGASARGGACKSEVMVSDEVINDLQFEVYERADGVRDDVEIVQIPARDIAVGLGNQIVANMVMLGNLAKHSEMVSLDLLKEAVMTRMRVSMREINIKALEMGFNF